MFYSPVVEITLVGGREVTPAARQITASLYKIILYVCCVAVYLCRESGGRGSASNCFFSLCGEMATVFPCHSPVCNGCTTAAF